MQTCIIWEDLLKLLCVNGNGVVIWILMVWMMPPMILHLAGVEEEEEDTVDKIDDEIK